MHIFVRRRDWLLPQSIRSAGLGVACCLFAAGCDLMPGDGPNANQVVGNMAERAKATQYMRVAMVGIDARVAEQALAFHARPAPAVPAAFRSAGKFGRAGIGDLLHVTIWEASDTSVFGPSARQGTDVTVRVDVDGSIAIPYAGRFAVAGQRLSDIEADIVGRLKDQAVQPQATVTIDNAVSSSASVQGDVARPGPYPIVKPDQRILDLLAMAGGPKYPPYDINVRLTRANSTMTVLLQDVINQPEQYNLPVGAGDTLLFTRLEQKFLAFGAVLQPGEQTFRRYPLSLADAMGQIQGLDSNRADAKAVYLFRREPVDLARRYGIQLLPEDNETVPIAYQLDLKDPRAFFVMSTFPVMARDIVYVATAPLAELRTFLQLLSGTSATVAIPRTLTTNFPAGS